MLSPAEFITDLFNPMLAFLPKALLMAIAAAALCGVIGCHVVLRGMVFVGDAVSHAVFPGLAIAFVTQGSLLVGGLAAGVTTAVLVAMFSQSRRLKEDSVIGVFFVGAFALGIVVISLAPGYSGSLQGFLFGSIVGIRPEDMYVLLGAGLLVVAILMALHKELVTVSLDRESAQALGIPLLAMDIVLYVLVTIAVVVSMQTIGTILVLALLVIPASAARMLTDRLVVMMLLAPAIGAGGALVGMYLSWSLNLPVGGVIVLTLVAAFVLIWLLSPSHGLVSRMRRPAWSAR